MIYPEPQEGDHVHRRCPFCKGDVEYFSLPWHTVINLLGQLVKRRMGPCRSCGQWVKPILIWPDEGDGRGWILEAVEEYEVQQITGEKRL